MLPPVWSPLLTDPFYQNELCQDVTWRYPKGAPNSRYVANWRAIGSFLNITCNVAPLLSALPSSEQIKAVEWVQPPRKEQENMRTSQRSDTPHLTPKKSHSPQTFKHSGQSWCFSANVHTGCSLNQQSFLPNERLKEVTLGCKAFGVNWPRPSTFPRTSAFTFIWTLRIQTAAWKMIGLNGSFRKVK